MKVWKGNQSVAGRSKTGLNTRLWVWHRQLLKLLYRFPHRLELSFPSPPARSGPAGPSVGRVLAEEHVRWRGEARSKPDTALAQAESGAHSRRVEERRKRGQVLLGQGIMEAQDAAAEIKKHTDGFDVRRDGAKRLLGHFIHCRKRGAQSLEPESPRTICWPHTWDRNSRFIRCPIKYNTLSLQFVYFWKNCQYTNTLN